MEVKLTGLCPALHFLPFLNIGVMFCRLQSTGTRSMSRGESLLCSVLVVPVSFEPVSKLCLNNMLRGIASSSAHLLITVE